MNFRTEITPQRILSINQKDKIVSLGSCFSNHMAQKLEKLGFYACNNPFGNIFHPLPIAGLISRAIHQNHFSPDEAQFINERYFLWQTHGDISDVSAEKLVEKANLKLTELREELIKGKLLLLTFGTAWGYQLKNSGHVVANCHKAPGNLFEKNCTSLKDLVDCWQSTINDLHELNPQLQIVTTVSPVRHWKDGAEGNSKSKAILRLLCDELERDEYVCYFPAFEILTDDLRDYRFYADDLLHPTPFAVHYVWQKFAQACITKDALFIGEEVEKLHRFLAHRPIHDKNNKAINDINAKKSSLQNDYPYLNLP